jgi:hypothetical protein
MAGTPGRSGGKNKKSAAELALTGRFRADRHADRAATSAGATVPDAVVSATCRNLPAGARRIVRALLTEFSGWDAAGLETVRAYSISCDRLRQLEADGGQISEWRREAELNLKLLRALNLETPR